MFHANNGRNGFDLAESKLELDLENVFVRWTPLLEEARKERKQELLQTMSEREALLLLETEFPLHCQ